MAAHSTEVRQPMTAPLLLSTVSATTMATKLTGTTASSTFCSSAHSSTTKNITRQISPTFSVSRVSGSLRCIRYSTSTATPISAEATTPTYTSALRPPASMPILRSRSICRCVTTSPSRTMTCPFLYTTAATAFSARTLACSVASAS